MPSEYEEYSDLSLKTESDILLLYYTYNYKIQLEREDKKALKYSPLYKMSLVKLEAVKKYVTKNLNKDFIKPFQSLFTVLILFICKTDESLHLCINFCMLNTLT